MVTVLTVLAGILLPCVLGAGDYAHSCCWSLECDCCLQDYKTLYATMKRIADAEARELDTWNITISAGQLRILSQAFTRRVASLAQHTTLLHQYSLCEVSSHTNILEMMSNTLLPVSIYAHMRGCERI